MAHMAQKSGFVRRKSRSSYAIKSVLAPYFLWKSLYFKGFLRHTTPNFMTYFGVMFFATMGGGGCRNDFQIVSAQTVSEPVGDEHCRCSGWRPRLEEWRRDVWRSRSFRRALRYQHLPYHRWTLIWACSLHVRVKYQFSNLNFVTPIVSSFQAWSKSDPIFCLKMVWWSVKPHSSPVQNQKRVKQKTVVCPREKGLWQGGERILVFPWLKPGQKIG